MADLREELGATRGRGQTDEYGNPIYPSGTGNVGTGHGGVTGTGLTGTGLTGTQGKVTDVGVGAGGQEQLRRSGSSSSSSEEDEHGVRRKKGLKDKIKEKLPGTHKEQGVDQAGYDQYGTGQQEHEKKGMMEKIKEKLPGGGHKDETPHTTPGYAGTEGTGYGGTHAGTGYGGTHAGTGYGTGTQGTGYSTGQHEPEKKGVMEKIKEKLPGGGHKEY
ncbi:hypothetical protein H6P81_009720 [Aristolochia fimbriata]|uniref:Dehydrin n=1 Tax=Aristolochia fimbriata TaxID=158543 RepID=A0AAV7ENR6_ARIFI|nr:hypothetical protein H6P81_009720 [Aristolochia fimbriata]